MRAERLRTMSLRVVTSLALLALTGCDLEPRHGETLDLEGEPSQHSNFVEVEDPSLWYKIKSNNWRSSEKTHHGVLNYSGSK